MTTTTGLQTSAVLAAARRAQVDSNDAEARKLAAAVAWATVHEVTDEDLAATFGDTPILIAGQGAPMIAAEAIAEFAAVVGMSTNAGRYYIGQAIELAHRLPRVYARIQAGTLPAWRGRRIAEVTLALSPEAAEFVDVRIAPFAHKTNPAETQRLVDTAIATLMPQLAAERREKAAEGRHFTFNHHQVSFAGTTVVWGELTSRRALRALLSTSDGRRPRPRCGDHHRGGRAQGAGQRGVVRCSAGRCGREPRPRPDLPRPLGWFRDRR